MDPRLGLRGRTKTLSGGPVGWKNTGPPGGSPRVFPPTPPKYVVCVRPRAVEGGSIGSLGRGGFCVGVDGENWVRLGLRGRTRTWSEGPVAGRPPMGPFSAGTEQRSQ